MVKISYDKEGDVLEIRFPENKIKNSEYIDESGIIVDYNEADKITAIEITSFSKRVNKEGFSEAVSI